MIEKETRIERQGCIGEGLVRNQNYGPYDFEFSQSTQAEIDQQEQFNELFGLDKEFYEYGDYVEQGEDVDIGSSDDESFYSDESNKDGSDDDLIFDRTVDTSVHDKLESASDREDNMADIDKNENVQSDESSVYADSDEERLVVNSSDDDESSYPIFNEDCDMDRPIFELGMCFKSSTIFRKAVKNAITERRPIENVKHYGKKVKYICKSPCKWKVYASPMQRSTTYQIKTLYNSHTCMPTFIQKQINSTWISEHYENEIRMNPTWPVTAFHKKVVNDLKCNVSKYAIYRAKSKALFRINGTHIQQFGLVWKYAHQLRKTLPGSTIKVLIEDPEAGQEKGRFQRFYICLAPIKKAFIHHCRRIIGLDGCHLKSKYGGQLLAAIGIDANNGMFPIAWAVVEAETTESWTWFLQYLAQDVKIINDFEWTFISDKQKGLVNALEAVVPNAEHRFCVMHLYQNMHKDYKGIALRQLLWKTARATTNWEFNLHMEKMKQLSKNCYDWLMAKPKEQWSRSGFRINCCSDMFVNNHCEVFNSSIRKFRDLPIITMLREIHNAVMKRIQVRRDKMQSKDLIICPSAQKKLDKALFWAGNCVVTWSGGTAYSVTCTDGGHELVVDLSKKTCTCRKWELTGIPCFHACACIVMKAEPWEWHINNCYKKDMYMKLYSHTLEPVVGPEYWEDTPEPEPLPPLVKVPTGRPKKKRSKKNDIPADPTKLSKQGSVMRCTYCKASTHNARTCQAKKNDLMKKATNEGMDPPEDKTKGKNTCKTCGQKGHNSRTCASKKSATEGGQASFANAASTDGASQNAQSSFANTNQAPNSNNTPNDGASQAGQSKSPMRTKKTARKQLTPVKRVIIGDKNSQQTSKMQVVTKYQGIPSTFGDEKGADAATSKTGATSKIDQWKGKPVTSLRQLEAIKNAKRDKAPWKL